LSLRKSPTRTPAFLEAIHQNAQKSTGPWTLRGKAQSCLNRLKTGARSRVYRRLWMGLLNAPPCAVEPTARELLTREQAAHPVFAEIVDLSLWAETMMARGNRWFRELVAAKQTAWAAGENEPQKPARAEEAGDKFLMEQKHLTPRRKGAEAHRKQSTFTFEQVKGQNKRMLKIDVGSRNVIENKGNDDILSCYLSDILGNSKLVLTEYAHFPTTKCTFSMRFGRQCTALATPRFEPQNLPEDNAHASRLTSTGRRFECTAQGSRAKVPGYFLRGGGEDTGVHSGRSLSRGTPLPRSGTPLFSIMGEQA
jgi:hypothetical protein